MYDQCREGNLNGKSKLTRNEVVEIKQLLNKRSIPQKEIARKYSVSQTTVSAINCGYTWEGV